MNKIRAYLAPWDIPLTYDFYDLMSRIETNYSQPIAGARGQAKIAKVRAQRRKKRNAKRKH